MASPRRIGVESSETRASLLEAAEQIMKDDGYPAVTTRRLASHMGVSNQLVHYYFRSMDELFIALLQRAAERKLGRLVHALSSPQPLRALWELYNDLDFNRLAVEFMALTNHRKSLWGEIERNTKQMRTLETDALARVLEAHGVDPKIFPPAGLAVMVAAIPRLMVMEAAAGVSLGHADATAMVNRFLDRLAVAQKPKRKTKIKSLSGKTRATGAAKNGSERTQLRK